MNHEVNKVLFIVNKFAGTGFQPQVEGKIIDACGQHDIECTIDYTQSRGHATELARGAAARGFQRVVAVGGDGTINEVAQGVVHTSMPMGIIPRGSGNGLARHLGIPIDMGGALQTIFNSRVLAMDTFTLNGHLSLNVSGIGFDGHIANLFGGKTKRGLSGYVKLTVSEFMQFREFDAEITLPGKTITRKAFIIAVANSSQYGNNARVAPAASVCDQLLHINALKKVPVYRFDFVYALFAGTLDRSSFCAIEEARELTIRTARPVAYHVDGEPSGHADFFDIRLAPAALPILVPNNQQRRL